MGPHADAREVLGIVQILCLVHGPLGQVVDAAETDLAIIEHRIQQFHHALKRTMTDQDHRQNQLLQPVLTDRQPEQDLVLSTVASLEGLIDGRGSLSPLLIDEFAADIVPLGDPGDGLDMPKGLYGQLAFYAANSRWRQPNDSDGRIHDLMRMCRYSG